MKRILGQLILGMTVITVFVLWANLQMDVLMDEAIREAAHGNYLTHLGAEAVLEAQRGEVLRGFEGTEPLVYQGIKITPTGSYILLTQDAKEIWLRVARGKGDTAFGNVSFGEYQGSCGTMNVIRATQGSIAYALNAQLIHLQQPTHRRLPWLLKPGSLPEPELSPGG